MSNGVQQSLGDVFDQLPQRESDWPEDLREDLKRFQELTESEQGLIPNSVAHHCFNVSRQGFQQMRKHYMFKTYEMFGKTWFSRRQLEDFSKINRDNLGGKGEGAKLSAMLKDALADAAKD